MKLLSKNFFDRLIERSSRFSAQRISRRSLISMIGNAVVASNSTTRFGWNGGVGMAFRLQGPTLFIEARYTRIETSPQPLEFIPITIGWRF